jgi:hypothetical protein
MLIAPPEIVVVIFEGIVIVPEPVFILNVPD